MTEDEVAAERAVLADELQQRGDPLGELIAFQLALEALPADAPRTRRAAIERRIAAHLDAHHEALFGPLAPHVTRLSAPDLHDPLLEVTAWCGGFADSLHLQRRIDGPDFVEALRMVRALPFARFVREIVFARGDHPGAAAELAREPWPTLRGVQFDEWRKPMRKVPTIRLREIDEPLRALLGSLEKVHLGLVAYRTFESATLRDFSFAHPYELPTCQFDARLPAIAKLRIYNCEVDVGMFDRYPRLEELHLNTRALPPGFVERLLTWPNLPRMRRLVLACSLTEEDLQRFVAAADRLACLAYLELWAPNVPREVRAAALARLPPCTKLS